MELQEALIEPFRLKLASRLQNHTGFTKGKLGWQWLDQDNVEWYEAARIALEELEHRRKATQTCFTIARRILYEHGLRKDTDSQFKIGGYCLEQMVLADWCWIEWHPDKKSHVVMIRDDTLLKSPRQNSYTSFKPFESWTAPYSSDGKQLVKPSEWTEWEPPDWHFTGKAPTSGETRLWHPFIEALFTVKDDIGHPKTYVDQDAPLLWVNAVNKLERNRYRINQPMLELIQKLDKHFPQGYVDKSASKMKNPKGKNKKRKQDREKFDSLLLEADRLQKGGTFYQRCHLDYRGRIYLSRSTLCYQGDDLERSLVEFADGVPLDDVFLPYIEYDRLEKPFPVSEGFKWLLLHAANLYEVPFDESKLVSPMVDGTSPITDQRIDVAIEHLDDWVRYANDPLDTILEWTRSESGDDLDDPLQFIRACMELRDALEHEQQQLKKKAKKISKKKLEALKEELITTDRDATQVIREYGNLQEPFISHIAVEQDQTNSVVQHLAMIYGSKELADKANLVRPSDFYRLVASVWDISDYELSVGEKRKVVKKVVVPNVYGAGDKTIAEQMRELPISCLQAESDRGLTALANAGINLLHRDDVAPEVQRFRDDMKDMITNLNLQDEDSVDWSTPTGFEVHIRPEWVKDIPYNITRSKEKPYKKAKIELKAYEKTNRLKVYKVETSIYAAVIHSIDGCMAQIMLAHSNFPVIPTHDAFSCHAANVGILRDNFTQNLAVLHQLFQPYAVIQRDVGGVPLPEGMLADTELVERARSIWELGSAVKEYSDSLE